LGEAASSTTDGSRIALFGARRCAGFFLPGDYCPDRELFLPYPSELPEVHRHLRLLDHLSVPPQGDEREFPLTDEDAQELRHLTGSGPLRTGEYVCIHPGGRAQERRWAPEWFALVADALAARGFDIVITRAPRSAS
jgi:ADP-heptose:LPS heptosyltransferase